jgi:hypothetical protein
MGGATCRVRGKCRFRTIKGRVPKIWRAEKTARLSLEMTRSPHRHSSHPSGVPLPELSHCSQRSAGRHDNHHFPRCVGVKYPAAASLARHPLLPRLQTDTRLTKRSLKTSRSEKNSARPAACTTRLWRDHSLPQSIARALDSVFFHGGRLNHPRASQGRLYGRRRKESNRIIEGLSQSQTMVGSARRRTVSKSAAQTARGAAIFYQLRHQRPCPRDERETEQIQASETAGGTNEFVDHGGIDRSEHLAMLLQSV